MPSPQSLQDQRESEPESVRRSRERLRNAEVVEEGGGREPQSLRLRLVGKGQKPSIKGGDPSQRPSLMCPCLAHVATRGLSGILEAAPRFPASRAVTSRSRVPKSPSTQGAGVSDSALGFPGRLTRQEVPPAASSHLALSHSPLNTWASSFSRDRALVLALS